MSISKEKLDKLLEYFDDTYEDGGEWLSRHLSIREYDDLTKTIVLEIWDVDEIDYQDIKETK